MRRARYLESVDDQATHSNCHENESPLAAERSDTSVYYYNARILTTLPLSRLS